MNKNILKTSADDLYELVKSRKKISVEEASKFLKLPVKTVHALVEFLVEEKIFGIEYKFTTPYIYLSEKYSKEKISAERGFTKNMITKEEFFEKAKNRNISFQKINELWKKYITKNIQFIKEEFYTKSQSRGLSRSQIDRLWEKYIAYLR
ncbi:hypothetical protein CMO93_00410 [Candidatus Woesearchaeota archaeon]|jgi:hypothetical protein|nr:hypothetical protein [Candidatus Woesearchaeota archaeon]|tara:strand:+ start:3219 stop:3668 length:450 start_codon:yes stop_codon:yes gene_type:complete